MAYYEGETLKQRIGRGTLGAEEALDIAIQTAQGLERAHQAGIVHRDIKPANLMITREGIVKILDFGIAKLTGPTELTATGVMSGTPSYMAPEQFRGAGATAQSDLWALGVVLYEMLTGAAPFRGGDAASVMQAVLNETPRSVGDAASDVPARLAGAVSRALAKKPEGRYRSVDEFRAELAACRQAMTEPAAPAGVREIIPLSNFGSDGAAPGGSHDGMSPYGTYDMAGNVREWTLTEVADGDARYILGGAWNEPEYQFFLADAVSPFNRDAINGFRTVRYEEGTDIVAFSEPVLLPARDFYSEEPASDTDFAIFAQQFAYDDAPLDADEEEVAHPPGSNWTLEKVTFNAGYANERVPAYLYLPRNVAPPYQAILFFPGANAVTAGSSDVATAGSSDVLRRGAWEDLLGSVILSGRAVMFPIYYGTFERNDGRDSFWPEVSASYREWRIRQVQDARRALDYLETRDDIDMESLGYFGTSWGASTAPLILALEPRFKAAVLAFGGLTPAEFPTEVDPINFAPRVSVPVRMINGDDDFIFPLETSQQPLYDLLGTAEAHKDFDRYPAGHVPSLSCPRQVEQSTLDWLDRYLGRP